MIHTDENLDIKTLFKTLYLVFRIMFNNQNCLVNSSCNIPVLLISY